MAKFKVGDIVRVCKSDINYIVGTLLEIAEIRDLGSGGIFYAPVIYEGIIYEDYIELCTPVDIERYKKKVNGVLDYYNKENTGGIEKYVVSPRKKISEINFEEPFFKKFLPFKKDKPMPTLAQEIFDRFLKSNKTKVIEAVEKAESIQNEITPLLKPFNELAVELATNKKNLERAFDNQDKEQIKFYLKELQEINSIFDDKLFDQLKTILKAINKSLSL